MNFDDKDANDEDAADDRRRSGAARGGAVAAAAAPRQQSSSFISAETRGAINKTQTPAAARAATALPVRLPSPGSRRQVNQLT